MDVSRHVERPIGQRVHRSDRDHVHRRRCSASRLPLDAVEQCEARTRRGPTSLASGRRRTRAARRARVLLDPRRARHHRLAHRCPRTGFRSCAGAGKHASGRHRHQPHRPAAGARARRCPRTCHRAFGPRRARSGSGQASDHCRRRADDRQSRTSGRGARRRAPADSSCERTAGNGARAARDARRAPPGRRTRPARTTAGGSLRASARVHVSAARRSRQPANADHAGKGATNRTARRRAGTAIGRGRRRLDVAAVTSAPDRRAGRIHALTGVPQKNNPIRASRSG